MDRYIPVKTVFLEDVAEALDETMDTWDQYLNRTTGEVLAVPDGTYTEPEEDVLQELEENWDQYVRLPNQYEIHEYSIMEDFAQATPNPYKKGRLWQALQGKKPYRHFKDQLNYLRLDEAYYAFRALAMIEIARTWCEDNEIPYRLRGTK